MVLFSFFQNLIKGVLLEFAILTEIGIMIIIATLLAFLGLSWKNPINKVINLVHKEGFNYLPVVDKDKKVLGVITPSSVIIF